MIHNAYSGDTVGDLVRAIGGDDRWRPLAFFPRYRPRGNQPASLIQAVQIGAHFHIFHATLDGIMIERSPRRFQSDEQLIMNAYRCTQIIPNVNKLWAPICS